MDPGSKERRRALEIIDLIPRRTPLSAAQKERLERASGVLRSNRLPVTTGERKKFFFAIGEIAKVILEVLEDLRHRSDDPE